MAEAAADAPASVEISRPARDTIRLCLVGRLAAFTLARVWTRTIRELERRKPHHVVVDASGVSYCDAVGAAFLVHLQEIQRRHGGSLGVEGFPDDYQPILDMLLRQREPEGAPPRVRGLVESVGWRAVALVKDLHSLVTYMGELVLALADACAHPLRVRWKDAFRAAETAGVNSFGVVALVAFLLGLVMGFQSAIQLRQFGADLYLANLVGLSMVRELGPLMTAVVLTARSGSAFAAELGTMKINEEVDALTTMGLDPVRFLVTPRVIAAVIMTPILTVFANLAGLGGGAVVWVTTLDLPMPAYTMQLEQAIQVKDLVGGLVKAFVFGIEVASIGCIRGMQTRGGASAVGASTTNAVVSGIVLIAVTDSVFSILYYSLGI